MKKTISLGANGGEDLVSFLEENKTDISDLTEKIYFAFHRENGKDRNKELGNIKRRLYRWMSWRAEKSGDKLLVGVREFEQMMNVLGYCTLSSPLVTDEQKEQIIAQSELFVTGKWITYAYAKEQEKDLVRKGEIYIWRGGETYESFLRLVDDSSMERVFKGIVKKVIANHVSFEATDLISGNVIYFIGYIAPVPKQEIMGGMLIMPGEINKIEAKIWIASKQNDLSKTKSFSEKFAQQNLSWIVKNNLEIWSDIGLMRGNFDLKDLKLKKSKLKIAVVFGGPSKERSVSLNSARSVCDHLDRNQFELYPIYIDNKKRAFHVDLKYLYSNTIEDFHFKIYSVGDYLSPEKWLTFVKHHCDLVFPVIHGKYGEDGEIQELLKKKDCYFIGLSSQACKMVFDKYDAYNNVSELAKDFVYPLSLVTGKSDIEKFFAHYGNIKVVIKPCRGGSSFDVKLCNNIVEAKEHYKKIKKEYKRIIIQKYCEGKEFSLIVLQRDGREAIPLIPIGIDNEDNLYSYTYKNLPNKKTSFFYLDEKTLESIRTKGKALFQLFGMTDFVRIDGWIDNNNQIWFSDFNPISGMEQNSFLFIAAAQIGMTHSQVLKYIIDNACKRYNLITPSIFTEETTRKDVYVIFGGKSSERQVSVTSGINVWLKLLKSKKYNPIPHLLDQDANVYELPYHLCLYQTVENIIKQFGNDSMHKLVQKIQKELEIENTAINSFPSKKYSLHEFIKSARKNSSIVFIAIHGDIGENGIFQEMLEEAKVSYTGTNSTASKICVDKYETGKKLEHLKSRRIKIPTRIKLSVIELKENLQECWKEIKCAISGDIIVKPIADGSSTGIALLKTREDLEKYCSHLEESKNIPGNEEQNEVIMPPKWIKTKHLLFEEYIKTKEFKIDDEIKVKNPDCPWIEVTVGLYEKDREIIVLTPSITIAQKNILSVEEKFQGGTGTNITPPPEFLIRKETQEGIKKKVKLIAENLEISGFARVDGFINVTTDEFIVIEVNTIPALTPSTVLFQQALAEPEPIFPREFLEIILDNQSGKE